VDLVEFEALANNAGAAAADTADALARASQLYLGDFLAGFNISLSAEFEAWALNEQTRLRAQMAEVLHRLADSHTQREELPQAIATVRRLLALEPWSEEAHRQLIGLLALNNDTGAALVQFQICRETLRVELDVEPGAATRELVAEIRAGVFPATNRRPVVLSPSQRAIDPIAYKQVATTVEYPLMGRETEWEIVRSIWQGLDRPHCIAIVGEAGIGKTRLTEELLLLVEGEGGQVARTRSHALQGQLAYGPITDWLRSPPLQVALSQLEQVWLTEIARLLPELFIAYPALPPPQPLQESWQRKQLFDALAHAFSVVDDPLLLVLDDLQWCDEDTLEWLQYLLERVDRPLLVVGTVRGDEIDNEHPLHRLRPQLLRLDKLTELHLTPLSQGATTELANHITQQKLSSVLTERLFQDTAGNPLFVVESMRTSSTSTEIPSARLEAETAGERDQLFMPAKMYQVIQARLAQLSPETQTLAQLGATIGRTFDVALLAQAADVSEKAVLLGLDELWQRRIVREVDSIHFDFSHDRIRDVAYAEISPIKRRLLHRQVANALSAIHAENLEVILGHLAVHYAAAGMLEQALTFHQRAADGAMRLFAHQEALNHRQQALAMLRQLPKTTENLQAEIDLLLALFLDQTNAYGKGNPVVVETLHAAYALAQKIGTS
jgi:tetratricopeptide (TPR) repeat protein